ncbi:MAG: amino acid ABC transporter substrate-binding protein [Spirochaetes bacterium]|nr:amino acid ABC transporter substrate-binding protein [Spirochaetota bacterium]
MRKSVFVVITVVVLTVTIGAKISKKQRLTVGTVPDNPPMEMVDEGKQITGFDIDVMNLIAERQKFSISFLPVMKENIYRGLVDGTYDIVISSITLTAATSRPEFTELSFSDPYLEIGEVVVVSEDFGSYSGPESLEGKPVGVLKDGESAPLLEKEHGARVVVYDGIEAAFEDMARGAVDAVACPLPSASRMVHLNAEYRDIFRIEPKPLTGARYVIAAKKENTELLSRINSGISQIKENGSLQKLIEGRFFGR